MSKEIFIRSVSIVIALIVVLLLMCLLGKCLGVKMPGKKRGCGCGGGCGGHAAAGSAANASTQTMDSNQAPPIYSDNTVGNQLQNVGTNGSYGNADFTGSMWNG